MKNIRIREDTRRDGLCMNFLLDEKMMLKLSKALPESVMNIGYPGACSKEADMCRKITIELRNEPVETAVVGHALRSHLELMAPISNLAQNTSANFWIPFSDYMIGQTVKTSPENVLENAKNMVYFWKSLSDSPIDVALVDSTANEDELNQRLYSFCNTLKEAGARNIIICDTKGIANSKGLEKLLSAIGRERENLEYHPHNDNGNAMKNVATMSRLGINTISTAVLGHGERGSMLDPRELITSYKFPFDANHYKIFLEEYSELMDSLDESEQVFTSDTVVTGTQYRLWDRNPKLKTKFGVTSDKHLLSKLAGIKKSDISDLMLESIKNDLYGDRKRVYSSDELKSKIRDFHYAK